MAKKNRKNKKMRRAKLNGAARATATGIKRLGRYNHPYATRSTPNLSQVDRSFYEAPQSAYSAGRFAGSNLRTIYRSKTLRKGIKKGRAFISDLFA